MRVSAATPGGRPLGNPRGTHGLGRGVLAKIFPEAGAFKCAFAFFGKPPRGSAHEIC